MEPPEFKISEIIRKLKDELDKGIATEVQIIYLLAGIRKLMPGLVRKFYLNVPTAYGARRPLDVT